MKYLTVIEKEEPVSVSMKLIIDQYIKKECPGSYNLLAKDLNTREQGNLSCYATNHWSTCSGHQMTKKALEGIDKNPF